MNNNDFFDGLHVKIESLYSKIELYTSILENNLDNLDPTLNLSNIKSLLAEYKKQLDLLIKVLVETNKNKLATSNFILNSRNKGLNNEDTTVVYNNDKYIK